MCEAFLQGEDIHKATAAKVFGVPLSEVSKEMRSKAKAVNFGNKISQVIMRPLRNYSAAINTS
jgi:hypothetical protein